MFFLLLTAATYFYFNWQYFFLIRQILELPRLRAGLVFLSFFINYSFFCVVSVLEFHLIVNWSLFSFLLFFETLIYNNGDKQSALLHTLMGIIYGLVVNIFCRSVIAIVMNMPLQSFDNHIRRIENLKGIPVCLGFLLAGIVLWVLSHPVFVKRFKLIIGHPDHQAFLLEMMAGLFFYLFINLLLYSSPLNDLLLKLWSIKSCLFCIIGFYIAVRYTTRICELYDYREQNHHIQQELKRRQREEEHLQYLAFHDELTGLYNRQYAKEFLSSMMESKINFALCFFDLDGLKYVNDKFGHKDGDRYIMTASEQLRLASRSSGDLLFRYGGDEFLAVLPDTTGPAAYKIAERINENLRAISTDFPYSLSFSYGVAESCEFSDWETMVKAADQRMYEHKQGKRGKHTR